MAWKSAPSWDDESKSSDALKEFNKTKQELSKIILNLLHSDRLRKKIEEAPLREISVFLKSSLEVLRGFALDQNKKSSPDSIEDIIKNLSDKEVQEGVQIFKPISSDIKVDRTSKIIAKENDDDIKKENDDGDIKKENDGAGALL